MDSGILVVDPLNLTVYTRSRWNLRSGKTVSGHTGTRHCCAYTFDFARKSQSMPSTFFSSSSSGIALIWSISRLKLSKLLPLFPLYLAGHEDEISAVQGGAEAY